MNKEKIVYLIAGKAQSGKNYISNQLKKSLESQGKKVCELAFADELKDYLCVLFGISREQLDTLKLSEEPFTTNGVTMRQLLQRLGTDIFKKRVNENYWAKRVGIKIAKTNYDCYIVTDMRFGDEICCIDWACAEDQDCTYIPKLVKVINNDVISASNHESESSVDFITSDIVIDNTDHKYQFDIKDFI